MRAIFLRKLRSERKARFTYDSAFKFALAAAGLAAIVHIVWFAASFVAFHRRIDAATMVIVDWDSSIFMMHIRIGMALLLSVVGLWSRRVAGLFLSMLALGWVGAEYIAWYLWSMRVKANAGIEAFPTSVPHASNFYGATPWNVVVVVLVVVVLLWAIWWLIKLVKAPPTQSLDSGELGR